MQLIKFKRQMAIIATAGMALFASTHAMAEPPPPVGTPSPILTGITILGPAVVDEETTALYVCLGKYSDGTTVPISVTWSENSIYTEVSRSGLLTLASVSMDQVAVVAVKYGGHSASLEILIKNYATSPGSSGGLLREVWTGISGSEIVGLTGDSRFLDSPDEAEVVTAFEAPQNFSDNYGTRMHGYLTPVISGSYTFWIAGDDNCELWLSSDATVGNGNKMAEVPGWTSPRAWEKYASQKSVPIYLEGGQRYYIKALHKEGGSGDHLSVAWEGPGIVRSIISGDYLEPFGSISPSKTVESLLISGLSELDELTSSEYGCLATYSDGSIASVSPDWKIITGPASISSEGILVAGDVLSDQTALVLASYGDQAQTKLISIRYSVPIASRLKIIAPAIVDELSMVQLEGRIAYSDGTSKVASPVWATDATVAFVDSEGQLITADVLTNVQLTVTATLDGLVATHEVTIRVAEDQVIYPLSGYEGRSIRAELYDEEDGVLRDLGQLENPAELIVENFISGRWYWLTIKEYDEFTGEWVKVQESWINM